MRRWLRIDAPLIVGVVLASAVFATAILAITGFAALAVEPSPGDLESWPPAGDIEGASGLAIDVSTHSGVLAPGWPLQYLICYRNHGAITEPVQLTDTIPVGTEFGRAWWAEGDPHAGEDLPPPNPLPGADYLWDLPDLGGDQERRFYLQVWLGSQMTPGTTITDCATIGAASDETTLEDNSDCGADLVNDWGPNLAVTSSHHWRYPDNGELMYELRFWNWGDQSIQGGHITDTFPVGTQWDGSWQTDLPGVSMTLTSTLFARWDLPTLDPGARGQIWFRSALEDPATPFQPFTNTVEVTNPPGDVVPANNVFVDVATAGGEVAEVDLYVATDHSRLWAFSPLVESSGWITVTTPVTTTAAHPGPDCRCWEFSDVGPIHPGDVITVTAGTGTWPVEIAVPEPFDAAADSDSNLVWGQIDLLDQEQVEVALYEGPVRLAQTFMGGFGVALPDVPKGAVGEVRYRTMVDWARVTFRRRFYTQDVVLAVHTRDNWVEGLFEAGHPVVIEVRASDDVTVKGRAELVTGYPPVWGGLSGFSTLFGDPWIGEPPDIVAGDWVHAWIDPPGVSGQVRVGAITGTVEVDTDIVFGTITAPWLANPLPAQCAVAEDGAPAVDFQVDPNGGAYLCDFGSAGWDLQPQHQVVVQYWDPESHRVINQFPDLPPILGVEVTGLGAPTTGGNFEYIVSLWNDGGQPAQNTYLTDTLPVGASYVGNTSSFTVTVTAASAVFDVGTLDPGVQVDFSFFTEVTAPVTTTITNTVEITASNVLTATVPDPSGWSNVVEPNDTNLMFVTARPDQDPEPGDDWEWVVEVCNGGSTSSATVIFTDTLPAMNPMLSWWANEEGWTEVSSSPEELVLERPTVSGGFCSTLHVLSNVSVDANPGQQLCNTVVVATDNDLDPSDNTLVECITVGGAVPAVEIQKATNGVDADVPPGPYIAAGEPVEWVYTVTNTGNITLTAITVADDQPGAMPGCPSDVLGPQEAMECVENGVAVEGQYVNLGTVTAAPPVGDPVSDSDPSHYFGTIASIDIEKTTNGVDADDPPGPEIEVGEQVEWSYVVRNTGNVPLIGVTVEDDQPGVDPDCQPFDLAPDEEVMCAATGVAVEGQYENLGTATGQPPMGAPVLNADPSHYLGYYGLPFSDGFESGDTSAWSQTVP